MSLLLISNGGDKRIDKESESLNSNQFPPTGETTGVKQPTGQEKNTNLKSTQTVLQTQISTLISKPTHRLCIAYDSRQKCADFLSPLHRTFFCFHPAVRLFYTCQRGVALCNCPSGYFCVFCSFLLSALSLWTPVVVQNNLAPGQINSRHIMQKKALLTPHPANQLHLLEHVKSPSSGKQ